MSALLLSSAGAFGIMATVLIVAVLAPTEEPWACLAQQQQHHHQQQPFQGFGGGFGGGFEQQFHHGHHHRQNEQMMPAPLTEPPTELYDRLGVQPDATAKEIRKAFKKVAMVAHPDKNRDDPSANERFQDITHAFEVLKDKKRRKIYDEFGEEGLKHMEQYEQDMDHPGAEGFRSWEFYRDMALYDDDASADVETFYTRDFWDAAVRSPEPFIVNFYSVGCSHCRELAPVWKELATLMRGVVGVGVIECQEMWWVCNQLQVSEFPTILFFGAEATAASASSDNGNAADIASTAVPFKRQRSIKNLMTFLANRLPRVPEEFELKLHAADALSGILELSSLRPVFVVAVPPSLDLQFKHAKKFVVEGLRPLGHVYTVACNSALCDGIGEDPGDHHDAFHLYLVLPTHQSPEDLLHTRVAANSQGESKEDARQYLHGRLLVAARSLLPLPPQTPPEVASPAHLPSYPSLLIIPQGHVLPPEFKEIMSTAQFLSDVPVLLVNTTSFDPTVFKGYEPPLVVLQRSAVLSDFSVFEEKKAPLFPSWLTHSRAAASHVFTPSVFPAVLDDMSYDAVVVLYSLPFCDPCIEMKPRWMAATQAFSVLHQQASSLRSPPARDTTTESDAHGGDNGYSNGSSSGEGGRQSKRVLFGTLDCSTYPQLCRKIDRYPRILGFFGKTRQQNAFEGNVFNENELIEYFQMSLEPSLGTLLSKNDFERMIGASPEGFWVVHFLTPDCRFCEHLMPQFQTAAFRLMGVADFAVVNCAAEQDLCREQGITKFPSIRFYLPGSTPRDWRDYREEPAAGWIVGSILDSYPSTIVRVRGGDLETATRWGAGAVVVMAGSPQCDECRQLAATALKHASIIMSAVPFGKGKEAGDVSFVKLNCDAFRKKCDELGVTRLPSVLLFQSDNPPQQIEVKGDGRLLAASIFDALEEGGRAQKEPPHDEL